ncbi:MAG: hypothetical protein QF384_08635 [Alphaproteobacteria bacterium]|nr:hypothetical protein [Alphaproteobacteria bacterium]
MKRFRNVGGKAALICIAILSLSACSLFQSGSPKVCPRVALLNDAAKMTQYRDGPGRDLIDVVYEARVHDVKWGCKYVDSRVRVEVKIDIVAQRGPASSGDGAQVPFFVAIIDSAQNIVAKKVFQSEVEFRGGRRRAGVREEIDQTIFLKQGEHGSDYEVIVGLQVSEQQLQQNRGRRF